MFNTEDLIEDAIAVAIGANIAVNASKGIIKNTFDALKSIYGDD